MGRSSWKDPMRLRGSGQFHFCPAPRTRAQLLRVAMASKIRIEWAFDSFFIAQIQRLPAPRVRASDANATRAQVKRARFAFTVQHLEQELRSHTGSRAVYLRRRVALGHSETFSAAGQPSLRRLHRLARNAG